MPFIIVARFLFCILSPLLNLQEGAKSILLMACNYQTGQRWPFIKKGTSKRKIIYEDLGA
jgi:hypothetical protein